MGLLVGLMDIATANNTVAIVMANPIAKRNVKRITVSAPEKLLLYWIHFRAFFRGFYHTERKCWLLFLLQPV